MKDLKWFEKKWFVNLKIKTRLTICFLLIAAITTIVGIGGTLYFALTKMPHWPTFAITIGIVCVIEIVIALVLGNINAFLVVDPMWKNERVLERYSMGNFDTSDVIRKRDWITVQYKDEIGSFSSKLKDLMNYLKTHNSNITKISEGDLTVDVSLFSAEDQIGNELSTLVSNFHGLVNSMVKVIEQVTAGADLVSNSSQALSQGTTEQASAIQQLTAALEQIASQTQLNAKNAEEANKFAKSAKENASEGNAHMADMLRAMEDISISSNNINNIIKVIDDIAFQTNILALNAAVEAARAGQHGKGFAVVADEVKNLAGKSADAAKETTELIENSIRKVEAGSRIANQTANALNEIVTQVDRAANLISSIAQASAQQASGIEQINTGISQVSQVIQTNAAVAEESAAASQELSAHAANLMEQASVFKLRS